MRFVARGERFAETGVAWRLPCAGRHRTFRRIGAGPALTRDSESKPPMGLFKPDFFRALAFGFLMGAAVMGITSGTTALATPDTEQASH